MGDCNDLDPEKWTGGPDPALKPYNNGWFDSHGTRAASLITAMTNNHDGLAAVSPSILVLPIRLRKVPEGGKLLYERCALGKALKALYNHFKPWHWQEYVRVVNMSISSPYYRGSHRNWMSEDRRKYDRLYVGSAGNDAEQQLRYPAAYDVVLGVTGLIRIEYPAPQQPLWCTTTTASGFAGPNYIDDAYQTYPVSGVYGWTNSARNVRRPYGKCVSPPGPGEASYGTEYSDFAQTSACCPQVSSLAALLFDLRPYRTADMVEQQIINTRRIDLDQTWPELPVAGIIDFDKALSTWQ